MGLAFLGLVGIWALIVNDVVDDDDIRWLLPIPWVLAGLGGLTALAVSGTPQVLDPGHRLGRAAARGRG